VIRILNLKPFSAGLLFVLMLVAAVVAHLLRPRYLLADSLPPVVLEKQVPAEFGDWNQESDVPIVVVNPQSLEVVNRVYSQVLTRNYLNRSTGDRVMLSIAYGRDQSDSTALHIPDVCYPAQGFQIVAREELVLYNASSTLPVRRFVAVVGSRSEPLTYWTVVGKHVALGGLSRKLAQISYGIHGDIPDGLVFRVSSISSDPAKAFAAQAMFIRDLDSQMSPDTRLRYMGSGGVL